jgi:hypothetical protein
VGFKFPKQQELRQESDRDCSVPVFARLAGVSEDEVRRDLPQAALGKITLLQWISWLEKRGFKVLLCDGCPTDIAPCAHLVATHQPRNRDAEGDVHDPSQVFAAMPASDPSMRNLSNYHQKVLTLSVFSPSPNPLPQAGRPDKG